MDEKEKKCSKFQGVLLNVVKSKLNLMLSEISQLYQNGHEIDFDNNHVVIKTILKKIAERKITSVHISPEEAVCFINIFDEMDSHTEQKRYYFNEEDTKDQDKNIYSDSPFK